VNTVRVEEYQVSERVVLRPGDTFRAKGGPYWKSSDGQQISLRSKGPYKFVAYARRGAVGWIECYDKSGCLAVLHVEGRRRKIDGAIVTRPYQVTSKKRQSQRLDNRKKRR
jgi:hypothetical protein